MLQKLVDAGPLAAASPILRVYGGKCKLSDLNMKEKHSECHSIKERIKEGGRGNPLVIRMFSSKLCFDKWQPNNVISGIQPVSQTLLLSEQSSRTQSRNRCADRNTYWVLIEGIISNLSTVEVHVVQD